MPYNRRSTTGKSYLIGSTSTSPLLFYKPVPRIFSVKLIARAHESHLHTHTHTVDVPTREEEIERSVLTDNFLSNRFPPMISTGPPSILCKIPPLSEREREGEGRHPSGDELSRMQIRFIVAAQRVEQRRGPV